MAKPTLMQTLLGRPSQKYSLPAPKHYYSDKASMMRIAAAAQKTTMAADDAPAPAPLSVRHVVCYIRYTVIETVYIIQDEDDTDSDVFYTPRSSIASDASMAVTTPPTSDAGHAALYTDQDWANDIHWLAAASQKPNPPKRTPPAPRVSRPPTPSIMMSMTTLLEENEDVPPVPPKPPRSSVIVTSHASAPPPAAHRRARSAATTASLSTYAPPSLLSGPPELPSYGTPAYTSLTVPPAPAPAVPFVRSNSISQRLRASLRRETADLSRSRLAQATMASVEVVGGLASPSHNRPPRLGFTHYRAPPAVPKGGVLVQVWAVGLDGVDLRLLGVHTSTPARMHFSRSRTQSFGRFVGRTIGRRTASDVESIIDQEPGNPAPQVGFIPGRSFVGRVLECGWEVRDEIVRRGEWVVGLLDVRKSGALAEFIIVDRHRVHRVPHPQSFPTSPDSPPTPSPTPPSSASSSSDAYPHTRTHSRSQSHSNQESPYPSRPSSVSFHGACDSPPSSRPSSRQRHHTPAHKRMRSAPPPPPPPPPSLDLAELALLPLAGVAAHRAVRTLVSAHPSTADHWGRENQHVVTPEGEIADPLALALGEEPAESVKSGRKGGARALVLHGHAGTGGLVARILARRGWRVCVHAPGSLGSSRAPSLDGKDGESETEGDLAHMRAVQARVRGWGVEEVVFDDGGCAADGEEDGGRARGAAVRVVERLIGDGDEFDAVVDTVGGREVWEAGERLLAQGGGSDGKARRKLFTTTVGDYPARPVPTAKDNFRAGLRALKGSASASTATPSSKTKNKTKKSKNGGGGGVHTVSYAWVSAAQDVDWEGEDEGVRPVVEGGGGAAVPFERAGEVFEPGRGGGGVGVGVGVLRGGSVVVRVVG
ncbi:hypothetical protein B0H19DRAFT_1267221 [Mycena capillaripes]|nr:hypothetical protein B0H19DRAFT_1267221 [Mycena capillaripes]